ncbi:MAG: hypothetical protein H0V72_21850 [Bradyrhizobium sp.]|nr:hypothetical protein [Bradyrhizobium sp.]
MRPIYSVRTLSVSPLTPADTRIYAFGDIRIRINIDTGARNPGTPTSVAIDGTDILIL